MYSALNTTIDDLFAFIIPMPTMHRLSVFRDDIIFLVFLYQRWLYPVDKSRGFSLAATDEDDGGATDALSELSQLRRSQQQHTQTHANAEHTHTLANAEDTHTLANAEHTHTLAHADDDGANANADADYHDGAHHVHPKSE